MSNPTFTKDRRKSTDVPQDAQANSQAQANLAPSPMGVSLDLTPLKKPIRPVKKPARAESDLEPVPGPVIFDAVTEQPLLLAQAQSAPPLLLAQAQNEVAGREFPSLFGAPVTSTTNESFKAIDASGPRNLTGFGLSDVALVAGSVVLAAASGGGGGANANSTGSGSGSPAPTVLPPVFQTIAVRNNLSGTATVDVTYSTKLDSQHPPLLSAFKLSKGGIDYTPNKIAISGNVISLDFYHVVVGTQAQALPFSYTGPGSDNSAQALLGSSGLPAADLLTTVVAVDNTPPTVTAVSVRALSANPQATVINGQADFTVTFSEGLSGTAPTAANFSAGAYATVTGVTPVANTTQYLVRVITKANVPSGTVALRLIGAGLSDAAGNAVANADLTSLAALAVDTVAPVVSISSVGGADSTVKALASDHAVVGTAEVGRPVTIKTGANTLGTATADASGHWSYMLTTANISTLGQGSNKSIMASQTDVAGNVGTSAVFKFSVDTVAPTVIAVTDNVSASMTNGWVVFTVTFSEALVGTVTTANFTAGPNGTVTDVITVTGANQCIVRVKPNAGVASGTVGLSVVGGG
jgi:hypothetical protein